MAIDILLVLPGSFLFAQKTAVVTPLIDTVKAKWGKIKIVDGAAIISQMILLKT